ncbi:MAG: hypothetical protein KAX13_02925, partial [Candidatus Krumholzibacteria bacterium]|nr:hypothetical protein [Candidatus Krumholzibacteria bacterium]
GFWSKLIIIMALLRAGYMVYGVIAILVGFVTLAYFIRLQANVLFGKLPEAFAGIREAPFTMVLPLVILAILCVGLGIAYPFVEADLIQAAWDALLDRAGFMNLLLGG